MKRLNLSSHVEFFVVRLSISTASPIRKTFTSCPFFLAVTAKRIAFQDFSNSFVSIMIK